ncbi:histidine phosphatase family protein [Nocardioides sp. TRM66260-LWL]|uniref:histidine phosphatase family protein n=1 Tax=Nocardioides sp. TRM66260-LWL TaxID=2874478 RepID=UPI001CC76828|nr:histidine phosphatase family protein [Nocardioides sp. TRM66260-LWL]MBZ5735897.1 histidine phosphatase family protein [Nocardioides sp. TRM66260-LWL]
MSRRLVVLRHGRTSWNAVHRVQGQAESELDEVGRAQAAAAGAALARLEPAVLWTSDLVRARDTAAAVATATGLAARLDARLREYFLAERQGLTHAEYAAVAPEEFARFRLGDFDVVPGGETAAQVVARMSEALLELLALVPDDGVGVAVSHGAAIRDVVPALLGWPDAARSTLHGLDNCGWVVLDRLTPDAPLRLRAYNRVVAG